MTRHNFPVGRRGGRHNPVSLVRGLITLLNAEIDSGNRVAFQRITLRRKAPLLLPAVSWMMVLTPVLCPWL
jgi:hypothetical protein